ncbi:PAS domain S-box protein [Kiritimatiellaeota bacterium B1221]|nr:PAS domain S-box protein [Kiritimatiellaeota bacterium B1221]
MIKSPTEKKRQKVLLVDDLTDNLTLLKKILSPLDVDVICVENGLDALEAVNTHRFSLAILDVVMPGMDGYCLGRELKKKPNTQELPLIFITASDRLENDLIEGYEIGAVDFIEKPFVSEVLRHKVRALLKIDEKFQELERMQFDLEKREAAHLKQLENSQKALSQSRQTTLSMMEDALQAKDLAGKRADRYKLLFQNMPSGFALHEMIYNDDGVAVDYRFIRMNPAFEMITGFKAADLVGKRVKEVLPETEQYWIDLFAQVVESGTAVVYENYAKALDKHFVVRAYRPEAGKFAVLISDVTENRRTAEQLKRTQFAIDNINDAVYWVNLDGKLTYVNQESCRELGYTESELLQLHLWDLDPDLTPELWPEILQNIKSMGDFITEIQHQRKNGSQFPVEVRVNYLEFGGDAIICGFAHNITERNAARDKLIASQQLTRSIIDSIPVRVFWKDKSSVYLGCNLAFAKDFGFDRVDEIIGKKDSDLPLAASVVEKYHADDQAVIHTDLKHLDNIDKFGRADSQIVWIKTNKVPLIDSKGQKIGVLGTYEDITESKQMQEAIERQVVALTRPLEEGLEIKFEDLFNLEDIQHIQDEFAAATNVASLITRPDGTPITRPSNFTDLCKCVIRGTAIGCANCIISDAELGRVHSSGPRVQPCLSGGLWDAGASITVGGQHVASWLIGQVRDETQTDEHMLAYAREIGANEEMLLEAFHRVPSMSREQFQHIADALYALAKQLSTSAFQNIQQARFIADEKRRTQELRRLSTAIEQSPEVIVITNRQGIIEYVNPAFEGSTGYTSEEALGNRPSLLKSHQHTSEFYEEMWRTITSGDVWSGRLINRRKDGSLYTEDAVISPVKSTEGLITNFVSVKRDVTQELVQEEKMQNAQKMEAVGQLAGGVAHDFNNILQSIMGFSDLLSMNLGESDTDSRECVEGIQRAADHAADLTRQLLAFSRKQHVRFSTVNFNDVILKTLKFLNSIIGENIRVHTDLLPELHLINADDGQLERALLNMALNARDAMPEGGILNLRTENITLSEDETTLSPYAQTGKYICFTISDTGSGIPENVIGHIFEPFYSTKPTGKGSGLGLAASYGIVRKHDGWIDVSSQPGEGATFKIYLPVQPNNYGRKGVSAKCKPLTPPMGAGQKILIVEDAEPVRILSETLLKEAGYQVESTPSAEEAELLFNQRDGDFDLLFSDIILPDKNGADLAVSLQEKKPGLQILLCSGYSGNRIEQISGLLKKYSFLEKPFNSSMLLNRVSEIFRAL